MSMRWKAGGVIVGLMMSGWAFALTPPLEKVDLEREADLIVDGVVGAPVECREITESSPCGPRGYYHVPFTIMRVHKGKPTQRTGMLRFWYQHYELGPVPHCTGDQGYVPDPGERGRYYLRTIEPTAWLPVHWSGVTVTRPGTPTDLPKCSTRTR